MVGETETLANIGGAVKGPERLLLGHIAHRFEKAVDHSQTVFEISGLAADFRSPIAD